jgi:hypothetical protein
LIVAAPAETEHQRERRQYWHHGRWVWDSQVVYGSLPIFLNEIAG